MPRKKLTADAEKVPKYQSPTNLGLVTTSTLQGYDQNVTIDKLTNMYLRQGLCYRIVNKRANDLFDAGFNILNNDPLWREIEVLFKQLKFMSELKQVQKYAYLHGVGFLLLGWRDSAELTEEPQNVTGIDYVIPLNLNKVTKVIIDDESKSPTYGEIIALEFTQKSGRGLSQKKRVHYKRFLTMIYDAFDNNPQGYSQVAPAYNYFETIENFFWSAGQAYYRYGSPLHFLKVQGATNEKLAEFDKQLPDLNAMSRLLGNERYELQTFQQSPADPRPFFEVLLTACCSTLGIPRQILEGTNAGAITGSETNLKDYYSDLAAEQVLIVQPQIEDFITACQEYGIIKAKGEFLFDWNSQFEQSELEKAQTVKTWAEAYQAMIIAGVPEETINENIPLLSADAILPMPKKSLIERKNIQREGKLNLLEARILRTLRAIFTPRSASSLVQDSTPSLLSKIKGLIKKDAIPISIEDEETIRDGINDWIGENEVRIKAIMPQIVIDQMRTAGILKENPNYDPLYQRIYQNNFNYIKGFNEDLRKDLSGLLSNGLQNNWTKGQLETEFSRLLKDMGDARLSTIVRTETNRAMTDVEDQIARLEGNRFKTWVTMGDDRVRPSHAAMDGETIPINEAFSVDGEAQMRPPVSPNCRCWLEYS